jgi:hypothetical protein
MVNRQFNRQFNRQSPFLNAIVSLQSSVLSPRHRPPAAASRGRWTTDLRVTVTLPHRATVRIWTADRLRGQAQTGQGQRGLDAPPHRVPQAAPTSEATRMRGAAHLVVAPRGSVRRRHHGPVSGDTPHQEPRRGSTGIQERDEAARWGRERRTLASRGGRPAFLPEASLSLGPRRAA